MTLAKLIIASSEEDSNLFYATQFIVPDSVIFFEMGGKKSLVLSDLEIDRAKLTANVHHFFSLTHISKQISQKKYPENFPPYAKVVDFLFKKRGVKKIEVPATFSARYYAALTGLGYKLIIGPDPFYQERLIKNDLQKKQIISVIRKVENVLAKVVIFLQKSTIKKNRIYHGKEVVTSELLKKIINTELMEAGCVAQHTIVSSGVQSSLPHHEGAGAIFPHQPIIFDIFPRDSHSRYFADVTRTFVKGKPSNVVKKMYAAVKKANEMAMKKIKPGIDSSLLHKTATLHLEHSGFKTGKVHGRMEGFIHSTGHGLGLDIHEAPSISGRGSLLKKGNVITIEPGLYYKKHGGIRLEDDV